MRFKNLVLVGTSHIARESVNEVEEVIRNESPDVVALELDKQRMYGLLNKNKSRPSIRNIRRIGVKGFLFSLVGAWIERKLGEKVGVSPGSEMLAAYKLAKEKKIDVALIDQDIEITLKRFSKMLTWKEKWNFVVDIVKSLIFRTEVVKIDLSKVPSKEIIAKLLTQVKYRYPNVYKVIVEERNSFMASKLAQLIYRFPEKKVVAFIGAGHEKEILSLVKKYINAEDNN
ncbi:MAG: TraB/GumN family protein [Nanoarchaeota archaeon]